MTTKKAQGISMTTIVIAAIALVVLIVLIMIFTGRIGGFTKGLDSCIVQGGFCSEYSCKDVVTDINGDGEWTDKDYKDLGRLDCNGNCCSGLKDSARYDAAAAAEN
ncbi:MAG: hypothetical protein QF506_02320 [Candidatus Woesearchaeota archaeon]|nr:hypothetical protein [Candidatus Woesearchaeota archaeon]